MVVLILETNDAVSFLDVRIVRDVFALRWVEYAKVLFEVFVE